MEIRYHVTGLQRKRLVQLISEITGCKPEYLGAPSFAYRYTNFKFDKMFLEQALADTKEGIEYERELYN